MDLFNFDQINRELSWAAFTTESERQAFVIHSLHGIDELLGLDRRRVDDLVDVLAVAVCIGGGDVNEGLEVVHLLGQAEELLRGDHVQLQGMSADKEIER